VGVGKWGTGPALLPQTKVQKKSYAVLEIGVKKGRSHVERPKSREETPNMGIRHTLDQTNANRDTKVGLFAAADNVTI
jgi:hypothetical protein